MARFVEIAAASKRHFINAEQVAYVVALREGCRIVFVGPAGDPGSVHLSMDVDAVVRALQSPNGD